MAQFAVIGLGSFGATVAKELSSLKHDVIGIDLIKKNVENISEQLTHAVIADATDEVVLKELNIQSSDAVVVAIGEDIEASILCVLHLKNMGVENIWVKAKTSAHHMILSHFKIKKIIHPEEDMGVRVAQALNSPWVSRYMSLGDDHYIVKVIIPLHLRGVNLLGLINKANDIKIILLKRQNKVVCDIQADTTLELNDVLVIEGPVEELKKLSNRFLKA
ncbi:trk system potassium uptake protein TrkA [Acinetobacter marinus]|uniref:Trk system potassium uptake protein TrkA n=1 Tax=Acinetobacter marinus TaxID=281375 RepID=A0A1G6P0A5_9GAMM|nr:TrkA family potassium uptake protein [Acinetobacter marinus]SDC73428.1 trk system potassium uptake protein TrkA [Acinetobacter marinus]